MGTKLWASTALTWGIPVDIVDLTANLKAYINTKKTLIAFRFCAQYGEGPDAHISKVPSELVALIEDHVVEYARSQTRLILSQNYKCFKAECTLKDHDFLNLEEEDYRVYLETFGECCLGQDFCDLHGNAILGEEFPFDLINDKHRDRSDDWSLQMESLWYVEPCPEHSSHGELAKALLKNFGLQAIVSDHSLTQDEIASVGSNKWDLNHDPQVTSCLLTLPCAVVNQVAESQYNRIRDDMDDPATYTSYLIDPASLALRAKDRKLFQSAMGILGLKPFVDPLRMQPRLSARPEILTYIDHQTLDGTACGSKRQANLKAKKFLLEHAEWPQLMNIVSSRVLLLQ